MSDLACLSETLTTPELSVLVPKCVKKNCKDSHFSKFMDNLLDAKNSEETIRRVLQALHRAESIASTKGPGYNPKLSKTCKNIAKEILNGQAKLFASTLEPSVLGEILESNCTLNQLERRSVELSADGFLVARELQAKLDAHIRVLEKLKLINYKTNNIAPIKLRDSDYQAYEMLADYDHAGNTGLSGAESATITSSRYLLSTCPVDIYQVGDLFQLVIEEGITLMVSAFVEGEKKNCISNFWQPEVLEEIPLRRGWSFKGTSRTIFSQSTLSAPPEVEETEGTDEEMMDVLEEKVVDIKKKKEKFMNVTSVEKKKEKAVDIDEKEEKEGKEEKKEVQETKKKEKYIPPVITEGKILFTNVDGREHEITHLHYNGWIDQTPVPDEDLLILLLDRMEELSAGKKFQLNCRHSRSRSATTMLCHLMRQEIRLALSRGNSLNNISINIPETIFKVRKQRLEFLRRPAQLVNVYSVTNKHYQRLKEMEICLLPYFSGKDDQDVAKEKSSTSIISCILSYI